MTGYSVLLRRILLSAVALGCAAATHAQTPLPSDVPSKYDAPKTNYDYVKRVEMISMRDECAHPFYAHAL
jgi:uncharacterized protein